MLLFTSRSLLVFFVCIYVLLLPIGTGLSGIIGSISLLNYFALAIMLIGILMALSQGQFHVTKAATPTILYYLYTVVSIIWSRNTTINWYVITNAVNFILVLVLTGISWEKAEIKKVECAAELSQIIVIIAVLLNLNSLFSYRLNITIVSTIGISDFACGLCLIIALWMEVAGSTENWLLKSIAYVSVALDFAIILMTGSRGALVMFAAMVVIWILCGDFKPRNKALTILTIILVLVLFKTFFVQFLPRTVTNRLTLEAIQSSRGSGRYNVWLLAWNVFKNSNIGRILVGYGFNSFLSVVQYGSYGGHQNLLAHNVVIQTMIEGGIIGLVLLIRMMYSQIRIAFKSNDNVMKFAVIGLFVASLSIDMEVTRIWGFILAFNLMRNPIRRITNGQYE